VSLPDVESRYGRSPFPPKLPYTPGYAIVGEVDVSGANVTRARLGERAAVMTVYGGYAEYVYASEKKLTPVPAALDPAEAVPLILNYIVAYRTLHRSAKVKAGDRALIIGASGGDRRGVPAIGEDDRSENVWGGFQKQARHPGDYGAILIDYRSQDFGQVIHALEPDGLDAVFDGVGGEYLARGFPLLKRGGV